MIVGLVVGLSVSLLTRSSDEDESSLVTNTVAFSAAEPAEESTSEPRQRASYRPAAASNCPSSSSPSAGLSTTQTPPSNTSTKNLTELNVVLFYADDWAAETLGIANNDVQTPNLDAMAARGMWFRNNYVTASICWQSRASLLTGMYASALQFFSETSMAFYGEVVQWKDTLFSLLRNQGGYHVGFVGKWHAPLPNKAKEKAFDFIRVYSGRHWYRRDGVRRHVTELNQADALEFLEKRPRNKKFALAISFFATHVWIGKEYPDSYMPQPSTESLYPSNYTIALPVTATEEAWNNLPWFFTEKNLGRKNWRHRGFDVEEHRQVTMKRMYRMATEVDNVVGAIIKELKQQGEYDNTLFIFTTDNGNYQGEHGLAGKWYAHDESIRVPLIIQDPRMAASEKGKTNDEFTLNIDLAPTILSAAGVTPPSGMQGRDIAQLYGDDPVVRQLASSNWRMDFFYEWSRGGRGKYMRRPDAFALVQKDWKYIYWSQTGYEQIFNLAEDPFEQTDVFNETLSDNLTKYEELRERYNILKNSSQRGDPQ